MWVMAIIVTHKQSGWDDILSLLRAGTRKVYLESLKAGTKYRVVSYQPITGQAEIINPRGAKLKLVLTQREQLLYKVVIE